MANSNPSVANSKRSATPPDAPKSETAGTPPGAESEVSPAEVQAETTLLEEIKADMEALQTKYDSVVIELEATEKERVRIAGLCDSQQKQLDEIEDGVLPSSDRVLDVTSHPYIRRTTWTKTGEDETDIVEIGHEEGHILMEESSYSPDILLGRIVASAKRASEFLAQSPLPVNYDPETYGEDRTNYIRVKVAMYSGAKMTDADIAKAQESLNA